MRMIFRWVSFLVAAALLFASCGTSVSVGTENDNDRAGNDEGSDPTSEPAQDPTAAPTPEPQDEPTSEPAQEPTAAPTPEPIKESTPEPAEEPTPEPIPDSDDQALAESLLLVGEDIGIGWMPRGRDPENPENEARSLEVFRTLTECDRMVDSMQDFGDGLELFPEAPVRAESPSWERNDDSIEFTVSVYPTLEEAEASFDAVEDAGFVECMGASFPILLEESAADSGLTIDSFELSELPLPEADDGFGLRIEIVFLAQELPIPVVTELAALRRGRVISSIELQAVASDFEMGADVLPVVAERLNEIFGPI